MKKLLIFMICSLTFIACGDLTDQNNDPKRSDTAPAGALLTNAEKSLMDYLTSSNVNRNIFRLLSQQWTQTTYTDESNYDLGTRNIPQNWWHTMYRDVLEDIRESKKVTEADEALAADVKKNQLAILEILEIYTWSVLIDTFGDIPYEDALKVTASDDDILQPEYDDAATIYTDLITRLNAALGDLNTGEGSWDINDVFYEGDVASWSKLGNSIKLKLGMTLADVNPSLAQTTVEAAAPNVFKSNDDNAIIYYKSAPPNTNPIWVDLVQSGRKDFVAANTFVNTMTALDDPRSNFYFTTVDTLAYDEYGVDGEPTDDAEVVDTLTVFYGGVYGATNNYATFSKPGDMVIQPDFQAPLMDYAEVSFYLAEAKARGWSWTDNLATPAEYYDQAITASMKYWGVSDADIADYLAQPEVAYASAPGTYREKIGLQKWLALYNRGFEAWTEWRRLDAPVLVKPDPDGDDIPLRYTYPVSEQNVNTINYAKAAEAIGGDDTQTKLFWDIY